MARPRTRPDPDKACSECSVEGDFTKTFGICQECIDKAFALDPAGAKKMMYRAEMRIKVDAYRKKCRREGREDKSVRISARHYAKRVPHVSPPPGTPPPKPIYGAAAHRRPAAPLAADAIAMKPTAAALSSTERNRLTVEEATHIELARRELARRKLMHFIRRRNPKYLAGWVHEDICLRLEQFLLDIAAGLSPRLMLFMPPRHGKSMICSEEFPAWAIGLHPEYQIIATSYGSDLATDFSRKVQAIVNSEDYHLLFNTLIHPDIASMELWATLEGGRYCAAGVGGPLTGRGAHILLIDDPIKNREQADNPTERKKIKDWYRSVAYPRLMPGGGVLIIQTRWHDDDLSGWLLAQMQEAEKQAAEEGEWPIDADKWEVVTYPAIATKNEDYRRKGDALHPPRYPLKALLKIKRAIGERDWSALFQQNPVPEEGTYFTKDMIRYYEGAAPTGLGIIAAGDLAISKMDNANYTAFCVVGVDEKDDCYVLDVVRGRWDASEIVDQIIAIQRIWHPQLIGLERSQVEQAIGPFLEKRIREEKLYSMAIEPLAPGKRDKQLRARPIQGRMRQGKVLLPRGKSFLEWFVPEMLRFPNGVNDDGVDAIAWIGQLINIVHYHPPTKPKIASWKDRLNDISSTALHVRDPSMAA